MNLSRAEARQASQLAFANSGAELEVGQQAALPLPLTELIAITPDSPWVVQHFAGGLTAEVFHLLIEGRHYTLKKKRPHCLVQNVDGQTSFLNEVQRRHDFEALKQQDPAAYAGIVDTVYASYRHGIILSDWIDGQEIACYTPEVLDSLFFTLMRMERGGVFELDPSYGNLLWQPGVGVRFYDFGYAYRFDPLTEFNPDGLENPLFHAAERFETRCFMLHVLDLEELLGLPAALRLFRLEKQVALEHYQQKLAWLEANGGSEAVRAQVRHYLALWQAGLADDAALHRLYRLESFRSCLLDVHDDLSGKSCNQDTLTKAQKVIAAVSADYDFIREQDGFFWGDEARSRDELLVRYYAMLAQAQQYQLSDLGGFNAWRERRRAHLAEHY